jgi:hypothetical protein
LPELVDKKALGQPPGVCPMIAPFPSGRRDSNSRPLVPQSGPVQDHGRPSQDLPADRVVVVHDGTPSREPVGRSWGNGDPVETALAEAIRGATAAGEWSTVAQLAKELEARRLARVAPNVVELRPGKRPRGDGGGGS